MTTIAKYTPSADLLNHCVIAVTGAGSGIGASIAKRYAAHGATVILLGRTISKLEAVYDEIEAAGGPTPAIYPIDFSGAIEKDFDDMALKLDQEFGMLHGLVHNAALLGQRTSITNYSTTVWDQVLKVNITAPFMMTKALLPLLKKAEQASIIFTSSSVGREGKAYWGAYGASKAALENMMQTVARECDSITNVRSNSFNPGATRTSMRAEAFPAEDPSTVKSADALMPYFLYLIGKDSAHINGQAISFDTSSPLPKN